MDKRYTPANAQIWQGRSDGFHQIVQCLDINNDSIPREGFALIGFACDEGVRRNQGRIGAAQGPEAFRKALASLPIPGECLFYDLGDITCSDGHLEEAQEALATFVKELIVHGVRPIIIGGDHSVAWGHYQGIAAARPKHPCTIINIDAHFDLRAGLASSGTSFLQIAEWCRSQDLPFDYHCLGIQQLGNSRALFEQAERLKVKTVTAEEFHLDGIPSIKGTIQQAEQIYLTICLDAFAAPFAPGVSAPQPLGLYPWHVIPIIRQIIQSDKVVSLDIAELAPPYDQNNSTAKLAANLVQEALASFPPPPS